MPSPGPDPAVTEDEVFDCLLDQPDTEATAKQLAAEFDVEVPTIRKRLNSLEDKNQVCTRTVGDTILYSIPPRARYRSGFTNRQLLPLVSILLFTATGYFITLWAPFQLLTITTGYIIIVTIIGRFIDLELSLSELWEDSHST